MHKIPAGLRSHIFAIILFVTSLISMPFSGTQSEGAEYTIRPSISVSEQYDDNIYLTHDDRVADYITRILPSVNVHYKTPLWEWTLDDTFSWWYYEKRGKVETFNDGSLTSKVNVIENFLYFDVKDIYTSAILNPRKPSTEINLATNRSDSNNLVASPYIKYQFTPSSILTTGYRYTNIWYKDETAISRQMHTVFATGEYKFSPVLSTYVNAEYMADRPEKIEPDNNQAAVFARAVYKMNPRTTLDGSFGYRWIDFSRGQHDTGRPMYDASLIYRFSEHGQIELKAVSVFASSPESGIFESRNEQATAKYGETFSVNGSIFHRKDTYLETHLVDEAYGVTAGVEYRPEPRLTFKAGGRAERDTYRPGDDDRKVYNGLGEIDYQLQEKMTLILSYNYTRENANISTFEYTDNVVTVQLRKTF
jgi:predicted porin